MRSIPFLLAAFLQDTALALVFAALPFRATELGAGPVSLGLLPTLYAAGYMLSASLGGRVSDRVPRLALVRRAGLAFSVVAASLAFADRLGVLFALLPLAGLALGFYWSPLQAALARIEVDGIPGSRGGGLPPHAVQSGPPAPPRSANPGWRTPDR